MSFPHGPVRAPTGLINVRLIEANEIKRGGVIVFYKLVTIAAIDMSILIDRLDLFSFDVIVRVLYDAVLFGVRSDVACMCAVRRGEAAKHAEACGGEK